MAEESLRYLTTTDARWFSEQGYTGELSAGGYLMQDDGRESNFLPSQLISGAPYAQVLEAVQRRLESEAPVSNEDSLRQLVNELKRDPRYPRVLEQESLRYLTTEDAEWFLNEYSSELTPEGYIRKKDGTETNFLPSQLVGPAGYGKVLQAVKRRLESEKE